MPKMKKTKKLPICFFDLYRCHSRALCTSVIRQANGNMARLIAIKMPKMPMLKGAYTMLKQI